MIVCILARQKNLTSLNLCRPSTVQQLVNEPDSITFEISLSVNEQNENHEVLHVIKSAEHVQRLQGTPEAIDPEKLSIVSNNIEGDIVRRTDLTFQQTMFLVRHHALGKRIILVQEYEPEDPSEFLPGLLP